MDAKVMLVDDEEMIRVSTGGPMALKRLFSELPPLTQGRWILSFRR